MFTTSLFDNFIFFLLARKKDETWKACTLTKFSVKLRLVSSRNTNLAFHYVILLTKNIYWETQLQI